MDLQHELVGIERRFWDAGGDGAVFDEHARPTAHFIVVPFGTLDLEEARAAIVEAEPWDSLHLHDAQVLDIADGVVALVYDVEAQRGDLLYEAMITTVYVHDDGRWRLALHQQTPIRD